MYDEGPVGIFDDEDNCNSSEHDGVNKSLS